MRAGCSHCRPKPKHCPCCGQLAKERGPSGGFYLWCLACSRGECFPTEAALAEGTLCPGAKERVERAKGPYYAECFNCGSTRDLVALDAAHMNRIHRAEGIPEVTDPFCCEA